VFADKKKDCIFAPPNFRELTLRIEIKWIR